MELGLKQRNTAARLNQSLFGFGVRTQRGIPREAGEARGDFSRLMNENLHIYMYYLENEVYPLFQKVHFELHL